MKDVPAFMYVALSVYFKFLDEGKIPFFQERNLSSKEINEWQVFLNAHRGKTYVSHTQILEVNGILKNFTVADRYKAVRFLVRNGNDKSTLSSYTVIVHHTEKKGWQFSSLHWEHDGVTSVYT